MKRLLPCIDKDKEKEFTSSKIGEFILEEVNKDLDMARFYYGRLEEEEPLVPQKSYSSQRPIHTLMYTIENIICDSELSTSEALGMLKYLQMMITNEGYIPKENKAKCIYN